MLRRVLIITCAVACLRCGTLPPAVEMDAGVEEPIDASVPLDAGREEDAGVQGPMDASIPSDAGSRPDAGREEDAGASDASVDLDLDGLDDVFEAQLARDALPVLGGHPSDACPRSAIVYRARKHPLDPTLVFIVYVHLYERDCGLTSHVGDDEVFAVTVNPATRGITAMRAISHQGTLCQRVSSCGTCNGASACETLNGRPVVYFSRDKHAAYVSLSSCGTLTCLDVCAVGELMGVPMLNAGEPDAPLTNDLTDAGLITAANGWSEASVMHFDPWGGEDFGGAGSVTSDLTDPAFETPACR